MRRQERELKQEDRDWFEPLVDMLSPGAVRFAYMQVRNVDVAQDIVQEAFAKVWASSQTPQPKVEFKRWLYRSISNLAKDHYRRERRIAQFAAGDPPSVGGDELERWLLTEEIMPAVRRLPIRDRQLIYLRYFEDQSMAECARLMGLNRVSVRVLVGRALGRLRRELAYADPFREGASNAR